MLDHCMPHPEFKAGASGTAHVHCLQVEDLDPEEFAKRQLMKPVQVSLLLLLT